MISAQLLGRVLILENDYCNRILFADYLEQCGYSVRCLNDEQLSDEQQIFESLEAFQPQVLILNLRMPVIDGYTIIEELRNRRQWQHLAILVVSGYTLVSNKRRAYQLGANAYLTKPILPSDLSASVAQLMATEEKTFPQTPGRGGMTAEVLNFRPA
ncbi:MAG: response regulator [Cyanobacteria bacterium P01_F01_bin.53]